MSQSGVFLTKFTGIYRCIDDIANLIIRVKIRDLNNDDSNVCEFRWQEKKFSKFEREFYANSENCLTDLEKKYHEIIQEETMDPDTKFDIYSNSNDENSLEIIETNVDENKDYDFIESVGDSIKNPIGNHFKTVTMTIMADFGEYVGTTWIRNEIVLVEMIYEPTRKILKIFPDFTQNGAGYICSASYDRKYVYQAENASNWDLETDLAEKELILKINNHKLNLKKVVFESVKFPEPPPPPQIHFHLFFEVLYAKNFENDTVFMQYFIDLPEKWHCHEPLQGQTQLCCAKQQNGDRIAHFGHLFELELIYDSPEPISTPPIVYFTVISKDSWDRYRTEGLTYQYLPIWRPGHYDYRLNCWRFRQKSVTNQLRRFFIGDCMNFGDLKWIARPTGENDKILNKFGSWTVSTGEVGARVGIVMEKSENWKRKYEKNQNFGKIKCSGLVKSVEQVLEAFFRAKKRMLQTREQIQCN